MPASAFAPLLLPAYLYSKPQQPPSIGAAIALQQGVLTTIHAGGTAEGASPPPQFHGPPDPPPSARPFRLRFNGQPDRPKWAAPILTHFSSHLDEVPLQIEQTTPLPDLGAPLCAARALSLTLALNAWCQTSHSPARCARLAQDALEHARQPAGFGVHLHGGLLRLSGRSVRARLFAPAELRLPIRLSYFGPASAAKPKKSALLLARKSALQAQRLLNARPSLLTFAAASRHFALAAHPNGLWASHLLAPRPGAGLCPGSKTIFEPGVSNFAPMVQPLTGSAPLTLIVHPSNLGARML